MDKIEKIIRDAAEHVIKVMSQRVDAHQLMMILKAYELAAEAHKNKKRKSGEPYISHPVVVALIVAEELGLGANTVMAAFLHDVVEDTAYGIEDIRQRFGDDVAFLVSVVTKQKKKKYENSKQVDSYRQILASVEYDVRAVLVKVADRLHNMRMLDSMRLDKQMKIAGETDYFYAPLANRLGLYDIKTELENLSFRFRCPQDYGDMVLLIKKQKEAEKAEMDAFIQNVRQVLDAKDIKVRIELQYRSPYSLWRKMQAKGCDFMLYMRTSMVACAL